MGGNLFSPLSSAIPFVLSIKKPLIFSNLLLYSSYISLLLLRFLISYLIFNIFSSSQSTSCFLHS
ncbi:hypothetical protein HanPSC8_Chr06g0252721 [Helianthus annuus]|nr:hypothetical protein HanPSC8_Chr06g0252721 [Helianthus annuus]